MVACPHFAMRTTIRPPDFPFVVSRRTGLYNAESLTKHKPNMSNRNTELSPASKICRSENSLAAEIDDELVLMSVEQGNYYGLDAIGADIWRRLEEPMQVSAMCEALCQEYEADADTIRRDVMALLERLIAEGLVEVKA
jgi:hypothetical protein